MRNRLPKTKRIVPGLVLALLAGLISFTQNTAHGRDTNFDTNHVPPWIWPITENQSNLSSSLTIGLYGNGGFNEKFFNNPQFNNALTDPVTGYITSAPGADTGLIKQYNAIATLNNVIFGDFMQNPSVSSQNSLYNQFLAQLGPGIYTTLPTLLFNSANVQNTQIQQRLWAVRAGSNREDPFVSADDKGKSVTQQDKKIVAPISDPEKKWVAFADGNGMWSQAQGVNNLSGYNTYAGGVQVGASRVFLPGLSAGPYVGYQGVSVAYNGANSGGSSAIANSVRFGLFGEYRRGSWYNDLIVGGAYNDVGVNHGVSIAGNGYKFNSMARGNVSGGEFDSMYGTGYEFKAGKFVFGPATSLQYTYISLGGTRETGAGFLDQNIGSQSTSSLLYTLGGQVSCTLDVTASVKIQPFLSLAWQHEFLQNGYGINSSILGQSYTYNTTNAGRDQYIAGIGGNLLLTKTISVYAVCNLINGDAGVFSQALSGGINWRF